MTQAWRDGRLVAPEAAHVSIADRGLLLGDGVFETILVHNGRAFDLDAHLARLETGLGVLGFAEAVDLAKLRADIAHYLTLENAARAVLRLTVTRGVGPRGLAPPDTPHPTILMTLSPLPPPRERPLSLHVATSTRRNELSPVSRIKALPYLDNLIAFQEARAQGADDAVMLNTRGAVACATVANLFVVREGRLETPPVADGALPGVMRALVLSLAKEAGLAPEENSLRTGDLAAADHVFLTNSLRGVAEAGSCNGAELRRIAGGAVERLRKLIAARLEEA
ncbi:aminotransferase class IV [Methylocapsa polymorpha]|uniref:Probable branched-chain-amino-acid aminotransferase n=1 Tax=Methylocapsa polymorpha TaxID=3080828 RepID=A0ABZ0HQ97_9HYPH|nr:aminotransferase class IV [Methylocapsa sp. RX1]